VFGGLLVGADKMQRAVQVPSSLVTAILGVIVLFVSGASLWSRRWAAKRAGEGARSSALREGAEE
jgi:simple sugar transport system permease protein